MQFDSDQLMPSYLNSVTCLIDVYQFSQVVRNLVVNAIKFTPSGGTVRIKAKFEAERAIVGAEQSYFTNGSGGTPGFLIIEVQDDGPGISEVGTVEQHCSNYLESSNSLRPIVEFVYRVFSMPGYSPEIIR